MRFHHIAAAAALFASGAVHAEDQTATSAFYASCLNSGGSPYAYASGAATDRLLVGSVLSAQTYSLVVAPATNGFTIEITRKNGTATLSTIVVSAGTSAIFSASEFSLRNIGIKAGEYCVRRVD